MHDREAGLFEGRVAIRIACPAESGAVSALLQLSYSHLLAGSYEINILERALPHIARAKPALLASGTYYVAEIESGTLVGCGGWTREEPGSGGTVQGEAHIRHFAVHPDWIKHGIGTALITRCIAEARSAGICKLRCLSTLDAEHFYQASGFQTVGLVEVPMGPGIAFPAIAMQREVS